MYKAVQIPITISTSMILSFRIDAQTSDNLCDDTSFIHISREKDHPYKELSKQAKNNLIWKFNSIKIPYETGKYPFVIKSSDVFDTIVMSKIYERETHFMRKRFPKHKIVKTNDTITTETICKFRNQHNYSLSQINPGKFNVFSLDTFNIQQKIKVEIVDFSESDNLFLHINNETFAIDSDTTINYFNANKEMKNDFAASIRLDNMDDIYLENHSLPDNYFSLLNLNFLFLHGEELLINVNVAKNIAEVSLK